MTLCAGMGVMSVLILAPIAEAGTLTRLEKLSVKPNPDGLQIGFWSNYRRMPEVLKDFGLRPVERVDFTKWATVETKPGVPWTRTILPPPGPPSKLSSSGRIITRKASR